MEPQEPTSNRPAPGDSFDRAVAMLTESQRRAIDSPSRAVCIVAGAGSGKTRVLTLRVARRIRDGSTEADHTAVCTFTRKAAGELRERLGLYGVPVSTPVTAGGVPGPGVRAGTLHQLALTLLRRHALDSGGPPPLVAEHRFRIVSALVDNPAAASVVDTEIGWAKARCLTPETYAEAAEDAGRAGGMAGATIDQVAEAFASYERALRRKRSLDLDDVLVHAADLLDNDGAFADGVRWRYRHLSVDEFQDVNPAQFRLLRGLLGHGDDVCVVGDPNQAIYGWNGADPSLLARLPAMMPGMDVVRLDENHRSTPQVVAAATAGLGRTVAPPPRSVAADGPMSVVTAYDDDRAEAEGVVSLLMGRSEDGQPWSDQAVLARTHDQLATIGRALARAGIPYRIAPGPESPTGRVRRSEGASGRSQPLAASRGPRRGGPVAADEAVELATFHRAKGLEWTSVHVVGLEEGYVPIVYAESAEAHDEERRLFYVALTRASHDLHCSWARVRRMGNGREMERQPSPWLAAVARVSRTGKGRVTPRDPGRRIAEIRAGLGN
ncbi:MAG: ATP-dependent helicase [Acidimicrobiales bacterium]|nr:ATP-dependent helicase [Acidimicrobiales bacterium]